MHVMHIILLCMRVILQNSEMCIDTTHLKVYCLNLIVMLVYY